MSVARRTWLPLSMLAAGLAGLGVLAWELAASDPEPAATTAQDDREPAPARAASAAQRSDEGKVRASTGELAARRQLDDTQLSPLQREDLRRLEQRGRARFWGVVLAPDGTPCEGATLFIHGEPRETSDARGAWSVEVEHDVGGAFNGASPRPDTSIVARKEGVGVAASRLRGPSRRVDLQLSGEDGHRLSGLCLNRVSRERVGGARVEMIFKNDANSGDPWTLRLATEADERGHFEFRGIPSGTFDLRGTHEDHDTNGWVPLDFSGARDRDYTLLFEPVIEVRGEFSPWPPPAVSQAPRGGTPRVVINPHSPQDSRSELREYSVEVGDDGRFRSRIPNCPRFFARLIVAENTLWADGHESDVDPRDVDLGWIGLSPPESCTVRGRVQLPKEFATFGPTLEIDRNRSAKLDESGSFTVASVPVARRSWWDFELTFAGEARISLRRAATTDEGDWAPCLQEGADFVAPDLVSAAWSGMRVGGRVLDEAGDPVAFAEVRAGDFGATEEEWGTSWKGHADERGRFLLAAHVDADEPARPWKVEVVARGFRAQHFRVEPSTSPGFLWCEARLARGERLHGTLVDDRGAPLIGWRVSFLEAAEASKFAHVITDASGEFVCFGLTGDFRLVILDGPDGEHRVLYDIPVVAGAIALKYSAPAAPSSSR